MEESVYQARWLLVAILVLTGAMLALGIVAS